MQQRRGARSEIVSFYDASGAFADMIRQRARRCCSSSDGGLPHSRDTRILNGRDRVSVGAGQRRFARRAGRNWTSRSTLALRAPRGATAKLRHLSAMIGSARAARAVMTPGGHGWAGRRPVGWERGAQAGCGGLKHDGPVGRPGRRRAPAGRPSTTWRCACTPAARRAGARNGDVVERDRASTPVQQPELGAASW